MKRIIVAISIAATLLLFWADAASAKDGWDLYRKARPTGLAKLVADSYVAGKVLTPFGVPEGPPIEYDRTANMDSVTIVIGPIGPDFFYSYPEWPARFASHDVILLKGNPPNSNKEYTIIVIQEESVIDPGASFIYDKENPILLQFWTGLDPEEPTTTIGAPDGEIVNFIGSGRTEKLFPEEIGSFGITGAGSIAMHNVVIADHQYGMSVNLTNFRNSSVTGSGVYVFNNTIGFIPPGDPDNRMQAGGREYDAQLNLTDSWFGNNLYADIGPIRKYSRFGGTISQSALMSPRPIIVEDIGKQWIERKLELRDCAYNADIIPYLDAQFSFASKMVKLTQAVNGSVSQYWPIEAPLLLFDSNHDGILDTGDLKYLADRFSQPIGGLEVPWYLDTNNNGAVDLEDLLVAGFQYTGTASVEEMANSAKAESLATVLVRYPDIVAAVRQNTTLWDALGSLLAPTAIKDESTAKPSQFALHQNYPNPFNSQTTIRFAIGRPTEVQLVVRDLLGRVVRVLTQEYLGIGIYSEKWDGKNEQGVDVGSGVYLYEMKAGSERLVKKLMILR